MDAARKVGVERVFYATMNRTQMLRQMAEVESFAEAMEDIDIERAERMREEEFGMEEADITHAVDVSAYLVRKRAAMLAHASQISADSFFEWFVAPGLPRTGDFATDLFR